MVSEINLDFYETADLLDGLFPWMCWEPCLKDILNGDRNGLPRIRYTVCPDGPIFHLANVASFALRFARDQSWTSTDFVEYMLEGILYDKKAKRMKEIDEDLDALLGITEESAA